MFVVDGNFTEWTPWTNCSQVCGGGNRSRDRTCTNPSPNHGGKKCIGESSETEKCNTHMCPSKIFLILLLVGTLVVL